MPNSSKARETIISRRGSLLDLVPDVAKEWDYSKNGDILPENIPPKCTIKTIWWRCPECGREWQQSPASRIRGGKLKKCKACAGLIPIIGKTDLATVNPQLSKEWHPTLNGDLTPSDVCANMNGKVWWLCPVCKHEWMASPSNRNKGRGCPNCLKYLRTSFPEQCIYFYVKKYYPDAINRFTDIDTSRIEIDVYIPSQRIGIEYDGVIWHNADVVHEREKRKYSLCKGKGITLIRIREEQLTEDETCDYAIVTSRRYTDKSLNDMIHELRAFLPRIQDFDVARDNSLIRENYLRDVKEKSVAALHPELIPEWDYEKNYPLVPEMFLATSPTKVWWVCPSCHSSYKTEIRNRCRGHGCKTCGHFEAGRKRVANIRERNPFALINPTAALDWDYEKNKPYTPNDFSAGSEHVAFWKCSVCGYSWKAPIARRRHSGCIQCAKIRRTEVARANRIKETGSLLDNYPELAAEWDYEKNGSLLPSMVTYGSDKKVWWLCPNGHPSYYSSVGNRAILHRGCPICGRINASAKRKETMRKKKMESE